MRSKCFENVMATTGLNIVYDLLQSTKLSSNAINKENNKILHPTNKSIL